MLEIFKLNKSKFYFIAIFFLKFSIIQPNWAQKTLKMLTLNEKIGQLFISAVVINPNINDPEIYKILENIDHAPIEKLIKLYHVGGILYLGKTTTPNKQESFTKNLEKISRIPLFFAQDLEWGLDMRLNNVIKFPYNITLGAIQDNNLIYKLGKEVGRQCQMIGININLAPVCDVNTNASNPVINHRSFGENKNNVAQKAISFMLGLQDSGIIACAKHFPGHGDTKLDSHLDLPLIMHEIKRLEDIEIYPFKKIIDAGIMSVMIGHLQIPALEQEENTPATISYKIITDLLKNKLEFAGLVITDALNMNGVLKYHKPGEVELKALIAGADILLCPRDTPKAIFAIKDAIKNGIFSIEELDKKVLKILNAKEWILKNKKNNSENIPENTIYNNSITQENFIEKLNNQIAYELNQELYQNSVTLVQNINNSIPLKQEKIQEKPQKDSLAFLQNNIACVQISNKQDALKFCITLKEKLDLDQFYLSNNAKPEDIQKLLLILQKYNTVIISLYNMNNISKENFGVQETILKFIEKLSEKSELLKSKNIILTVFGNPYSLKLFNTYNLNVIIAGYEDNTYAQIYAAKIILGERKPVGTLSVSASKEYYASLGLTL